MTRYDAVKGELQRRREQRSDKTRGELDRIQALRSKFNRALERIADDASTLIQDPILAGQMAKLSADLLAAELKLRESMPEVTHSPTAHVELLQRAIRKAARRGAWLASGRKLLGCAAKAQADPG